jgi:hypothetical protein
MPSYEHLAEQEVDVDDEDSIRSEIMLAQLRSDLYELHRCHSAFTSPHNYGDSDGNSW